MSSPKLHPRNIAARLASEVTGNPISSRLESGVGNCFPGLECDLRNLERRFFPFLVVDFFGSLPRVAEVDLENAQTSAAFNPTEQALLRAIHQDQLPDPDLATWRIHTITGTFGSFGQATLDLASLGGPDLPEDAWTAVRLLDAGQPVTLSLRREPASGVAISQGNLTAPRADYLDPDGALAPAFRPGELTQSLCSPWTHDFRDCGCFYWSSNHPDISLPRRPTGAPPNPAWDEYSVWQRSRKGTVAAPPAPATARPGADDPREMRYYEINNRWGELGVILDEREQGRAYAAGAFTAQPFATVAELASQLRYAAGVELAVTLEYLAATWSLRDPASAGAARDDVRAARAELLRIAYGEMRHMRAVNDVLHGLHAVGVLPGAYTPALGVAAALPFGAGTRPLDFGGLTPQLLDRFIAIERPSGSVDGLYGRILATLRARNDVPQPLAATIEAVMTDGFDHFETFSFIKEWLSRHAPTTYLRPLQDPPAGSPEHAALQAEYVVALERLHDGYTLGLPGGAALIAQARTHMLGALQQRLDAAVAAGIFVRFDVPADPRFAAVPRP